MHFKDHAAEQTWYQVLPPSQQHPDFIVFRLAELWANEAEHLIADLNYEPERAINLALTTVVDAPIFGQKPVAKRITHAKGLLTAVWRFGDRLDKALQEDSNA